MDDPRREILEQLKAGQITPEEAATKLDELAGSTATATEEREPETRQAPPRVTGPIRRVKIITNLGSAIVVGDPTVNEAVADGPHNVRIDGDTMVIEHRAFDDEGFRFENRSFRRSGFVIGFGDNYERRRMAVRMNPRLELEANITAGNFRVQGVQSSIVATVSAGSCRIDDFVGTIQAQVNAGSFKADGVIPGGTSKITCEAGSVSLRLRKGTNIKMRAKATMGSVKLYGDNYSADSTSKLVKLGTGEGSLDIEANLGSVRISTDE